jgi:hypothetical protein
MLVFISFFIVLVLYTLFSYILTEPNLVLSSNPIYWNFQVKMWENYYHNSEFITGSYIFLIIALFVTYIWIVSILKKHQTLFTIKSIYLWAYSALLFPLFLSYNALSHDIFNYIFNARMVLKWGENPHLKTALDFVQVDKWVRFMHNIHTPAPYGYGWTLISLVPSYIGFEKLLPTLVFFRLFMILGMVFLYFSLQHLSQTLRRRSLYVHELALVFLNPLLLLEVVSNYHNDLWMMAPAILALSILLRLLQPRSRNITLNNKLLFSLASILLLSFSISIKLVTILMLPIFIFGFLVLFFLNNYANIIKKRFKIPIPSALISAGLIYATSWLERYIPAILAILFFIPLLTDRSQQFLPWYMLWILVWVPFIKNKTIKNTILIFTLSSLLRYVPWLSNSFEYSDSVQLQQRLVTWVIPVVYLFTNIKRTGKSIQKLGRIQL